METLYVTHPACHMHEMGASHPESPKRLDAVSDQLTASRVMDLLRPRPAREASRAEVERVHDAEYLDFLYANAPREGYFGIDPDTLMNPATLPAAHAAAGAGLTAVESVLAGEARTAFCAVRPPGHHARPGQAMGFCFFNNVAVAARHALDHCGLPRLAIVDFDVHHGNGTEEVFLHDDRVLMCSFYQYPFFPYLRAEHAGANMVNIPVSAYSDGAVVRELVVRDWLPALHRFRPELILVSAGFDAHREDDMGMLGLVEEDYAWMTRQLVGVAERHACGRVVSLLEGGYDLSALGRSAVAHVRAMGGY